MVQREIESEMDKAYEVTDFKELEDLGVSQGTGRVIGKFVGTKSEWKKKLDRVEKNGGRQALNLFLSLPF